MAQVVKTIEHGSGALKLCLDPWLSLRLRRTRKDRALQDPNLAQTRSPDSRLGFDHRDFESLELLKIREMTGKHAKKLSSKQRTPAHQQTLLTQKSCLGKTSTVLLGLGLSHLFSLVSFQRLEEPSIGILRFPSSLRPWLAHELGSRRLSAPLL